MIGRIIYFDCAMMILDLVTIIGLRRFLLDFLRVKKNRNNVNTIYANQSLYNKITLSFIKEHLKNYIKAYKVFHKLYLGVIYTIIPQYMILVVCNILMGLHSVYVLGFFAIVKIVICFIIRINVDSNRISIYRKK